MNRIKDKPTVSIAAKLCGVLPLLLSGLLAAYPAIATAAEETIERAKPLEPVEALKSFVLAPGLRIELVACEPEVVDPVSIRFDEDGRLWVVEMRDYPLGPPNGEQAFSKIRVLEDRDGDGRFETSQVFADKLLFPTGLQPWRGGVFVTLAGRVAYLKDTDGDGRADVQETWFTGFAEKNTQLRANHPTLGLDGYVYVANGLRGGSVVPADKPDQEPLDIRSHDFRFDPVTRNFVKVAGNSQHGMTFDDFGNRFLCSNRNPLMHVVIENRYAGRNPNYALPAVIDDVARAGEASRVYAIGRSWTTSLQHAGQFTAACGTTIYRGTGLPSEMVGNAFTCEPTANLVHREVIGPAGATFRSRPGRDGVEFLASRDEWFRPIDLKHGPDGALYMVDMYRAVIEHPQFMPEELRKRPDLRDGDNRGRIYRIVAEGATSENARPQLSTATSLQLVEALKHPNAWWRETAVRLLLEREDNAVADSLRATATTAKQPATRMAALYTLLGLKSLSQEDVVKALNDSDAGVRQQAIVFAEKWLDEADSLRSEILALAHDADPKVRFQVALSLAPMKGAAEVEALRHIALVGADDPWTRRAVAISSTEVVGKLLLAILGNHGWQGDGLSEGERSLLVELIDLATKSSGKVPLLDAVQQVVALPTGENAARLQRIAMRALFQSHVRRGKPLAALLEKAEHEALRSGVQAIFNSARKMVAQPDAKLVSRLEAISLLGYDPESLDLLARLSLEESAEEIRLTAIEALAVQNSLEPWQALLAEFPSLRPTVRSKVLAAVLARPKRVELLLAAIENETIRVHEIDRLTAGQLLRYRDQTLRERAKKILETAVPEDRAKVLADYKTALHLDSDPARGREVFRKQCSTCHLVAEVGVRVGPDIGDNYAKKREQILTDILQPNRAIDSNYMGYLVQTDDGRTLSGLLLAETVSSITLQQEQDKKITLAKSDIEEIRSTGISLMPDGLEKNIPHQDMADLLSFLKNWRYLDGLTPYSDSTKEKK
ncbi:MAG: c-type cytochrome [Planctomycetes bacterium]|nr:c-type cytochrome [Planctomycetota bacterium]